MKERNEKGKSGAERIPPELVAQARAGDQAAFTELYERTSTMVYRTIRSMVRDEDLVWDIQQDSYLRAWRSLDKLEANEAFLPWLRRIAVNTAAKTLAKRVPLTFTDLAGDEEDREPEIPDLNPDVQPELALDRKETSRLVREILAELSPEQQAVVGMFYYEDMPVKDIAALLQISPSTVKNQLFRGRKKVEIGVRALEKQGVKLYGLSPLPFLLALLRRLEPAKQAEKKALAAVLAEAPAVTAAGTAAGSSAVTIPALTAGQAFLKGLGVKLLAGVLAVTMIAVGGKLAYDALSENRLPFIGDERPTAEETLAPEEDTIRLVEEDTVINVDEDTTPETDLPKLYAPNDAPENACGPNLTWRFEETTGTLTIEGSGAMYDYSYEYYEISSAPWNPYVGDIKAVIFPTGLTTIGEYAFCECTELTSVSIPKSVTTIGESAFSKCTGLTSVTIPEGVTAIGDRAFSKCTGLTSVTIPEGVTAIGDRAFRHCSGLRSVLIPEGLTIIGEYAFAECTSLTSVTIPEGVTTIEYFAFAECTSLKSVSIPGSVTTIGSAAFSRCSSLTSVEIPEGVASIGDGTFSHCSGLEEFSVHPENQDFAADENGVLYNKTFTTLVAIPCGKSGAFVIPENVTTIRMSAFYGCAGLTSVTIPESVTNIEDYAFCDCTGLTSVTIPTSETSIRVSVFRGCTGLTSVTIPESVTFISSFAFSDCTGLTSVTIPAGVTFIGNSAFDGCIGLKSVTIPEGVTFIGNSAFNGCTGLTLVTIPEGVTTIEDYAFNDCPDLTIRGTSGSEAERYANENDIPFKAIP